VWHQEEPCPHTSQYAQWKVMELARQNGVTVLLDGQGADEYLAGYQSPGYGYRYAGLLRDGSLPQLVQELRDYRRRHGRLSPALASLGAALLPLGLRAGLRARYHRADDLVATDFYHDLAAEPPEPAAPRFPTPLKQELYRQLTRTSLPSLLRYGARNSMAFSVEARLPFLDHRLVELAFGAPDRLLVRRGLTKVLLREAMQPVLPPEVYTRVSKLGFPTPEQVWLRGPLRGWLRGTLDKACARPFINGAGVEREWRRFLQGGESANLWRVAHTELWWQKFFG
jgi:asparagine synthase (glutamine-hydrolysing)